jgi:hypothetical protein
MRSAYPAPADNFTTAFAGLSLDLIYGRPRLPGIGGLVQKRPLTPMCACDPPRYCPSCRHSEPSPLSCLCCYAYITCWRIRVSTVKSRRMSQAASKRLNNQTLHGADIYTIYTPGQGMIQGTDDCKIAATHALQRGRSWDSMPHRSLFGCMLHHARGRMGCMVHNSPGLGPHAANVCQYPRKQMEIRMLMVARQEYL